jgi:nicotinate-nucleotide adenylyltransferase
MAADGGSLAGERSLGVLGGTFNPPHLGHLALARHARKELGLERVMLVPTHTTPYKANAEDVEERRDPGPEHRLRMCRLAVQGVDGVTACAVEIERGGLSYTVDTLRSLHASHPHAELTFIVGADTASTLGSWREPEQLLELAQLAVATRVASDAHPGGRTQTGAAGQAGAARRRVLEALGAIELSDGAAGEARTGADRVRFLQMPPIEVSSSLVRRRVAGGEAVDDLVGPAVAGYIAEHGLYRAPAQVLP